MQGTHVSENFANSIVVQKEDVFLDCPEGGASQVPRDADYGLMSQDIAALSQICFAFGLHENGLWK